MMRRAVRLALVAVLGLGTVASSRAAHAEASASDRAAARVLFDDARKLMSAGNYADACPKLEESQRLDPGIGTQFNLADCQEHVGKTASAWTNFLEAASSAKAAGQAPREKAARERAAAVEAKLSRLSVVVQGGDVFGLEVKRDGAPVGKALWGTAVPIDPGAHTIVATAPGKKRFEQKIVVGQGGPTALVTVPKLEDDPSAAAAPIAPVPAGPLAPAPVEPAPSGAPPPADEAPGSWMKPAGFVAGGIGIAGIAVGAAFGVVASSKLSSSKEQCRTDDPNKCTPDGVSLRESAQSAGTVSTIAFIAGGVFVAGGVALLVAAPSSSKPAGPTTGARASLAAGTIAGPDGARFVVRGNF